MKYKVTGNIALLFVVFSLASCLSNESIEFKRYYSAGAEVYQTHCQNCHGTNGEGLSALIPALNDSVYLKNNKSSLACYLKFGLKGNIQIHGKDYSENMPASDLAPMDIARVMTYINNSFGNKLGLTTLDQVETNLNSCK
jgi:mono/diheme cytochrome c family protein